MADVVTTVGKNKVAEKLGGLGTVGDWSYLAIGSSGTAATAADTALKAELTGSAARASSTVTTATANILQLVHTWSATGSKTVKECGVFNDAATGTVLARSNFATISLSDGDSLQITYKVTVS